MSGLFINDSFTLSHTVKARGPIPALTVKYRPALPERIYQWREDTSKADDAKAKLGIDVELLLDQLLSWSVSEPLNAKSLSRLWPQIITDLLNAVSGYSVQDQADVEGNSPTG